MSVRVSEVLFGKRAFWAAALAGCACTVSSPTHASENGASFYLLGSGGPEAAILPPVEGVFFDNTVYYYSGEAGAERELVVGGDVVLGLEGQVLADFATLLWVPSTDFIGGTLALGAALPIGYTKAEAGAVLTGPGGNQVSVSADDDAVIVADPVLNAAISWDVGGNWHVQAGAMVNIPIGHYREDELANLSFHRWAVDTSFAASWHDAQLGWDVSGKVGVTFNGENDYTNYETGDELHFEAAIEKIFSPAFSAGAQFYYYDQISGDSGDGAVLGPNKGRVSALGVTAAYNFRLGKTPVTARFRIFDEFDVERRMDGTAAFFSLTLPLSMKMPAGQGA